MKKQSRTVPRRRQSVSPTPRHLPLVDILIDTQAELPTGFCWKATPEAMSGPKSRERRGLRGGWPTSST